MSANKTVVIVLCSFLAAGIVCLAVGLGVYFTAIDLPASADDRGARVLAGIIILDPGHNLGKKDAAVADCRTEIITLPYLNEKQISKRVPTLPHWLIDSYPMSHSGSQPELVETGETSKYDNYIGRSMLGSVSPIDDSQQTLRERETFSLYKMLLYS